MINKIKKWYTKKKKEKYAAQWQESYDWAAGKLLRGEETPLSIELTYGIRNNINENNPFHSGVSAAINKLLELKAIKNDYLIL
jgi:hypothetical protein